MKIVLNISAMLLIFLSEMYKYAAKFEESPT